MNAGVGLLELVEQEHAEGSVAEPPRELAAVRGVGADDALGVEARQAAAGADLTANSPSIRTQHF